MCPKVPSPAKNTQTEGRCGGGLVTATKGHSNQNAAKVEGRSAQAQVSFSPSPLARSRRPEASLGPRERACAVEKERGFGEGGAAYTWLPKPTGFASRSAGRIRCGRGRSQPFPALSQSGLSLPSPFPLRGLNRRPAPPEGPGRPAPRPFIPTPQVPPPSRRPRLQPRPSVRRPGLPLSPQSCSGLAAPLLRPVS